MVLTGDIQQLFEQLLVQNGYLTQAQLNDLKLESVQNKRSILSIVTERNLLEGEDLVKVLAQSNKIPYVDARNFKIDPKTRDLIPRELAASYRAVPLGDVNGRLAVGMLDPTNLQAVDLIARKIGKPIVPYMLSEASIDAVLEQYDVAEQVSSVIESVGEYHKQEEEHELSKKPRKEDKELQNLVQDAPITRALRTILDYAVNQHASDIHIEPRAESVKIRFRIDGILQEIMELPKSVEAALVSRIKILSNLKIDEHRLPQDGEFHIEGGGQEIDLRIAIAPIVYGEQVVIRLLTKDKGLLNFEALGFRGDALKRIKDGAARPHGMILITGPTGSGKSTSLYTIITYIRSPGINIVTLEDPVEYKIEGINQIQVDPGVGLTFATGLRSILRQDPDVIMVGEIRDEETANLAVQAALTGHIVLSTLHTNSASGVLPRLLDMKVEPFLIGSTVNTVVGQRLVRKICDKCTKSYQSTETETNSIRKTMADILPKTEGEVAARKAKYGYDNVPLITADSFTLYKGEGCEECNEGYKGRMGIYEVFSMSPAIEELLATESTTSKIQAAARKEGMLTMKEDGYLKALNGVTTLEEVARVAADY